jgi:hypothetical protein
LTLAHISEAVSSSERLNSVAGVLSVNQGLAETARRSSTVDTESRFTERPATPSRGSSGPSYLDRRGRCVVTPRPGGPPGMLASVWAAVRAQLKVKGFGPLACKTDKIDVWVRAELSRRDLVSAIWPPTPGLRGDREPARWRLHRVRHRTALKSRIHADSGQHSTLTWPPVARYGSGRRVSPAFAETGRSGGSRSSGVVTLSWARTLKAASGPRPVRAHPGRAAPHLHTAWLAVPHR